MPLAYFKDRFLPEEECFVPINDRSFRFGDGVFETLLVYNGHMYDAAHHHERLQNGLTAFKVDLDISRIETLCHELITRNQLKQGYVRIVVSRGVNGANAVGYLPKGTTPYMLIQSVEKPYPGIRSLNLWLSTQTVSVHMPSKTNNALVYTLAMMEAEEQGCDNALLLNDQGCICETASGNIFWVKDGTLCTPSTDLPLVPGTMRRRVLELWDGLVRQGHFPMETLQTADEIFMTNIASIVASVSTIKPLGIERAPGMQTQRLRQMLDNDIFNACHAK